MSNITNFVQAKINAKTYPPTLDGVFKAGEEFHVMVFQARKSMTRSQFREWIEFEFNMTFEELGRCIAALNPWIELKKEIKR